jgi:hypothetical protein
MGAIVILVGDAALNNNKVKNWIGKYTNQG